MLGVSLTCFAGGLKAISVVDTGAHANDGLDDTAAINSAIAQDPDVYFPAGVWIYNGAMTLPANRNTYLHGSGPNVTVIKFSGSTSGINGNGMGSKTLQVKNLTLNASGVCGTAIYGAFTDALPPGYGNTKFRCADIENVEITGSDRTISPASYFMNGISLYQAQNSRIEDVQIHGKIETSNAGIAWTSSDTYGTTQLFLHNIYVAHFKVGIQTAGHLEGFYMNGFELLFCGSSTTPSMDLKASASNASYLPVFHIENGHTDFLHNGIELTNVSSVRIFHVNFLAQKYDGTHVYLNGCYGANISDNTFSDVNDPTYPENTSNGILCNDAHDVILKNNEFSAMPQPTNGNAIGILANCSHVRIMDNIFESVNRQYSVDPNSTDVKIRDF